MHSTVCRLRRASVPAALALAVLAPMVCAGGARADALAPIVLPLDAHPASASSFRESASTPDEIGGDDVFIMAAPAMQEIDGHSFDIAENGDLYVATVVRDAGGAGILLFRSQDGGDSWQAWGSKHDADPVISYSQPTVHVAEGNVSRVYLAYLKQNSGGVGDDRDIWVSWASTAGATPVWTDVNVLDQPGIQFEFPDLVSDAEVNGAFHLFLVATAVEATTTDDLWISTSTDFGTTWTPEYLFWSSPYHDNWNAQVRYGRGGLVHVLWESRSDAGTFPRTPTYRRATNFASTYADFSDTTWYLTGSGDAYLEHDPQLAVSHGSDHVVVTYTRTDTLNTELLPARVLVSTDAGYSWSDTGEILGASEYSTTVIALPGTAGFTAAAQVSANGYGIQSSTDAAPQVWTPLSFLSDRSYSTGTGGDPAIDFDATRGNRTGMIWRVAHAGSALDSLVFDAEWRSDPGYPNVESGFPIALPSAPISPPAICELDGDVQGEIVFADSSGNIRVYNHDGTPLAGWPIDIGLVAADSPVSVGDLDGDGRNEVVCGDTNGNVHAFRRNGTVLPGFPVAVGSVAPCYAAIGAVLPGSNRQVAAVAGTRQTLIMGDGVVAPGWPSTRSDTLRACPAIGDVDNDGDKEIVVVFGGFVQVNTGAGAVQSVRNLTASGKTFSNAPTLGDLNLDGDLEIVAPSDQGDVYVLNPDGTDYPGWPYVDPQGARITSVALAQARATSEVELAFAVEKTLPGWVHARYLNNTELSGFPDSTHSLRTQTGAPIWDVLDEGSTDLVMAPGDHLAWAWDNFGGELPAWPKSLAATSYARVSPASGDLDQDGKLEVVFALSGPPLLTVIDVGANVQRQPSRRRWYWPMYGYNAQRSGCLACDPDAVIGAETLLTRLEFSAPAPNPSASSVVFRFVLPAAGAARLALYDVLGRRVRDLVKQEMPAGAHSVRWDGRTESGTRAPAGAYYARLTFAGGNLEDSQVRRVTLLH